MSRLEEWGMMDAASRPKQRRPFLLIAIGLVVVVLYVAIRNFQFVKAGMLKPDFGQIHRAYDFNLWELPWTLLVLGLLAGAAGWLRRDLFWLGGWLVFLAVDLFALRYWVTYVEPNRHEVRHVRIATPKLTAPVRLLHITDIQSGGIGEKEESLFQLIQELEPDIILNTGDYVQPVKPRTTDSELPKLIELVAEVNPRYGTYGVYGDTDYLLYRFRVDDFAPMRMLSSRSAYVQTEGGGLSLHGLNLNQSRDFNYAQRSIEGWLAESDPGDFRILLGHSPNYALGVSELPIDLCLAGHTHGGQVWVPGYGPLVTYSEVPKEWARGFRQIGVPYLNVSAGAGSNRFEGLPPIRFNCPTEVTLFELVPIQPVR
ncbi:MAG: metallophosphoesterase [Coraliomargarita sp.]